MLFAASLLLLFRPAPPGSENTPRRFTVTAPAGVAMSPDGALTRISPDGRTLVFTATDAQGAGSLWIRPLDSLEAHPLRGTEGASLPFWSPDGESLGFFAGGKLKTISIAGGAPKSLCDARDGRGGAWSTHGTIVFAPEPAGPLYSIPQSGGEIKPVTALDASRKETAHQWPWPLPDGKRFLYVAVAADRSAYDVFVGSTDSMERTRLLEASGAPVYASPGFLIYAKDGTLVAQRFDARHRALAGEPVSVGAAPAPSRWTGAPVASASRDGILARPHDVAPQEIEIDLDWSSGLSR
jgi:hypothetical protein